jgi:hypothetical protein
MQNLGKVSGYCESNCKKIVEISVLHSLQDIHEDVRYSAHKIGVQTCGGVLKQPVRCCGDSVT